MLAYVPYSINDYILGKFRFSKNRITFHIHPVIERCTIKVSVRLISNEIDISKRMDLQVVPTVYNVMTNVIALFILFE